MYRVFRGTILCYNLQLFWQLKTMFLQYQQPEDNREYLPLLPLCFSDIIYISLLADSCCRSSKVISTQQDILYLLG
jgi:hypothetical protein